MSERASGGIGKTSVSSELVRDLIHTVGSPARRGGRIGLVGFWPACNCAQYPSRGLRVLTRDKSGQDKNLKHHKYRLTWKSAQPRPGDRALLCLHSAYLHTYRHHTQLLNFWHQFSTRRAKPSRAPGVSALSAPRRYRRPYTPLRSRRRSPRDADLRPRARRSSPGSDSRASKADRRSAAIVTGTSSRSSGSMTRESLILFVPMLPDVVRVDALSLALSGAEV